MMPTNSARLPRPRLPVIQAELDNDGDSDSDVESDEDIEILLRKTKFFPQSKSAHANLAPAQMPRKQLHLESYGIEEENEQTSSDSDEEFYVHKSLLPFRKSKSSTSGFNYMTASEEIKTLGTFKASEVLKVIEKQTKEMLESHARSSIAAFVTNNINIWPPPDDAIPEKERKTSQTKRSSKNSIKNVETPILIPFGRTASAGSDDQISITAWSAPPQLTDSSDNDEDFAQDRMRSWSALERVPFRDESPKYSTRKGISLSQEHLKNRQWAENTEAWKKHHSADDMGECQDSDDDFSVATFEKSENDRISKIDEKDEELEPEDAFSSSNSSTSASRANSNESIQTPPNLDCTSTTLSASKSDSHLKLYDRPRTPICGEQNPTNSTQEIYDPWHSDVDEPLPGPIRSRSCHDTLDADERLMLHCQMCPSPDCQKFIEKERKNSVRVCVENWDEKIDDEVDSEFAKLTKQETELRETNKNHEKAERLPAFENCFSTAYDDEDDIPMADDPEFDSPLTPFLARKFVLQRLSPPMASEDDLSDVEMTEIGSDEEEKAQLHKYNLSGLLVRKSASDFGWSGRGPVKVEESVGNLNYWLNEGRKQPTVKRSSTTSAIRPSGIENEPVYANLRPIPTSDPMNNLPTFLSCRPNHQKSQMKKSATSGGFPARNMRRLLPIRPDFPATPEEAPEYANLPLPCSVSYHERVNSHQTPFDATCFFPTTSYNISKEMQHENFARIQMAMENEEPRRPLPVVRREPSFTALTLAEEIENEKKGIPPKTIDPGLAMKIVGRPDMSSTDNADLNFAKKTHRRTLPPLPIDAFVMSHQSPIYPNAVLPSKNSRQDEHQICFGIDASMVRSTSGAYGIEDSYYEDGINGNISFPRKSNSMYNNQEDSSGVSSCCTAPDSLTPTHRVQSVFIPRHDDEVLLEIGDALHVERVCEDHWCFGTNLRTGQHGIFPQAHICEIDFVEEICAGALSGANAISRMPENSEHDVFYLTMLASIEVAHHKGNDVLVQSINKVCQIYQNKEETIVPQTVLMEISFRGIHIIDKRRKDFFKCPTFDFFYSLQNISFCGAHPKQLRYFGFITKHPLLPRFACHVFLSNESTQPIVESIGRAFKRSYDEYMAFAHQTVDEYLE